jgi:hypothetical protein
MLPRAFFMLGRLPTRRPADRAISAKAAPEFRFRFICAFF